MKAVICKRYGSPEFLEIVEIATPTPTDNQVRIKIYFTTVTVADHRVRAFDVPVSFWLPARIALGFTKPRQPILGGELSGVIDGVGKNIKKYKVGDKVFAFPGQKFGAHAEYICMNENDCIALKPGNLSFQQAAALPLGAITAWFFLTRGKVTSGEKILIYGASGSMGTYAVQMAKYLGSHVTAVCSTNNVVMVSSLGADKVIDYTVTDFTNLNDKYDVIFDTVGKTNIKKTIDRINLNGRYLHAVTEPLTEFKIRFNLTGKKIKLFGGTYNAVVEQLDDIKKLADKGAIKPVIDRQYNFGEIVEAHRYVDKGHKKGNVVIKITDNQT